MGGSARRARPATARVPADARSGGRPRTAGRGASQSVRARYLPQSLDAAAAPLALSLGELLAAVDRVLRRRRRRCCTTSFRAPRCRRLRSTRARRASRCAVPAGRDVVPHGAEPWQILSVLLALLELAKLGELRLAQPRPFASVEIRRERRWRSCLKPRSSRARARFLSTSWPRSTPRPARPSHRRARRAARALRRRRPRRRARGAGGG